MTPRPAAAGLAMTKKWKPRARSHTTEGQDFLSYITMTSWFHHCGKPFFSRHCEERSDEAISFFRALGMCIRMYGITPTEIATEGQKPPFLAMTIIILLLLSLIFYNLQ
jgi:hypothetical protein